MAAEAVARVVLRCEKAQEEKQLDLSSCLLEAVPQAVYHLMRHTELLTFDLSHNALVLLSKKLAINFTHLTDINASHNKIEKLPVEMNLLTLLQTLNVSHNQLTSLPETFYELQSLRTVDLSHNDIKDLDASKLCNMATLKEINLEHNPIPSDTHAELLRLAQESDIQISLSEPPLQDHMD